MQKWAAALLVPVLALSWLTAASARQSATDIDSLLAAVNGSVITRGDLQLARDLNAVLGFGRGGAAQSPRQELERIIDLELIRQELKSFDIAAADEGNIQSRLDELRNGYAEIGGLPVLLRRLGLRESELLSYLQLQVLIMRFIDFRFRPFVSASDAEIEAYYGQKLVPALRKAGSEPPPLGQAADQIREILIQEKVNEAMEEWVRNTRSSSRIEYFPGSEPAEAAAKP
jgi:hypothetical protein